MVECSYTYLGYSNQSSWSTGYASAWFLCVVENFFFHIRCRKKVIFRGIFSLRWWCITDGFLRISQILCDVKSKAKYCDLQCKFPTLTQSVTLAWPASSTFTNRCIVPWEFQGRRLFPNTQDTVLEVFQRVLERADIAKHWKEVYLSIGL